MTPPPPPCTPDPPEPPRPRRTNVILVALSLLSTVLFSPVGGAPAGAEDRLDVRLDVGGLAPYTAHDGLIWQPADAIGSGSTHRTNEPIAGTQDDPLYQKHRWGMSGHDIAVPCAATYRVGVHFAETVFRSPGERVFDVIAEGDVRLARLDVQSQVGTNAALVEEFDVVVEDGVLDLDYRAVVEDPMVSAVRVSQLTACAPTGDSWARRIDAGSNVSYADSTGASWTADAGFADGFSHGGGAAIAGTEDDPIYQTHRWGVSGYRLEVPCEATYEVALHFAETVFTSPGQRVFDVSAEGDERLAGLDVQAEVGTNVALVETFDVGVTDGALDLAFRAVTEDPMLSGLVVTQVRACGTSPDSTTTTTTTTTPSTSSPAPTSTSTSTSTTVPTTTTTTTTAPPPPSTPTGAMPTPGNTGPVAEPTETITPAQAIAARGAKGKVISGSLRIEDWGGSLLGTTFTFEDCVIKGSWYSLFDDGGSSSYPLDRYPTINIRNCRIEGSFVSIGAVRMNMDRTHVTRGAGMITPCPDCAGSRYGLERAMPWNVTNSLFVSPPGDPSSGYHTEAMHVAGTGQGYRFANTRFVQEGPVNGTQTGALFFHGGASTFDGSWFDDGDQGVSNAYHYTVYAYGTGSGATQNVVRNSAIERGMAWYVYPGGSNDPVVQATYTDNRDFHTGAKLTLP